MIFKKENLNKPYTRMWIYGCSATNEEIDINIKHLKDANIGGVEVQMIYPLSSDNNKMFFSKEFFEMMNYFVDQLHANNIDVDLTLGSGWPFGAPFITKDMSPDILIPYQQDIKGPQNYNFDFTNILSGKIVRAVLAKVEDAVVDETTLIDVTSHIEKTFISVWPWGEKISNLEVGEGNWRLFVFVSNEYRQHVGKAAPNMDGYVMDHCRKDVTDSYIENFANVYLDNIDSTKIRSVFCDSIELTASNWTKYLLDEFKNDHGYDLSKYLPALWMDIGEKTPYIRHDYYQTYGRLTIENFFKVFKDWSDKKNVEFRLQAHGTWGDIIDAYGASHIPEGETFGFGDSNSVNINHRRLAVSSGIIYDKKIVSNESYTWLRKPRFLVTMDMLKRASDAIFCDGINHIINHGYSFYKNERYENIFYASSLISPHNTWFKHYSNIGRYLENCMNILQNTKLKPNLVVFTPTSHIWSTNIMAELHMSLQIEKHFTLDVANEIHRNGHWFSFINDYALTMDVDASTIVIPKVEYMKLETLKTLVKLSKEKTIIFTDVYPSKCAGLLEIEYMDVFNNCVNELIESNNTHLVNHNELPKLINKLVAKDFTCDNSEISYINRYDENNNKYTFISNITDEYQSCNIFINNKFKVYDPHSDKYINNFKYENNNLIIDFKPNESFFIIECEEPYEYSSTNTIGNTQRIEKCVLEIENEKIELNNCCTWETLDKYKYFSGDATYVFNFDTNSSECILKLPFLYGVASVYVNGILQDTVWYSKECMLNNLKSTNELKIIVTSNIFNEAINRDDEISKELLSDEWPYFNGIIENHRHDKMYTWRDKEEHKMLLKSGIDKYIEVADLINN